MHGASDCWCYCRGHRHCLPAASHQVPSTPASRPRPMATSWSPANSLTLLEVFSVRAGTGRRAASCGDGVARRPTRRPIRVAVESKGAILVADVVHNLRRPCGNPVNKRGYVSDGSWPTRTRPPLAFAAASAFTAEPAVPDHPQRRCGTGGGASRHLGGSAGRRRRDKLNGWAACAGVSGAGVLESEGAEGATITAPMNMTNSSVTNTRKRSRAAFVRAAWVISRLHRPAVASLIAGNGQGGRSSGPRGDGGSAARAAFAWERSPRTRKAHQANTGAGQERPGWEISRREFGTRARHAQDPGWFDNRSATITLNDKTVQEFRVPRPGSGMHQTRARALLTRLAVSRGRCRGFHEIRPAAGANAGLAVAASTTPPATAERLGDASVWSAKRAGGSGPRTL